MKSETWINLFTIFIQAMLVVGDPPDLYNCVDWDCEEWISKGKTLLRYHGKTERHLSFKQNQDIYILAKPVDPIYGDWLAKTGGKTGLVPKDMVREDKMGKAAKFKVMLGEISSWNKDAETEVEASGVEIQDVDDEPDIVSIVSQTKPTSKVETNKPSISPTTTLAEVATEPPTPLEVSAIPPVVESELAQEETFEFPAQEEQVTFSDIASDPVIDSISLQPSTDTVLQGTTSVEYFSETPKTQEQKPTDNITPRIPETISLENIASIQSSSVADQETSTQLEIENLSVSHVEKLSVVPEPETVFHTNEVQQHEVTSSDAISQPSTHEEATIVPNTPIEDVPSERVEMETAKEIPETMRMESTSPVPTVIDANDEYDDEEEDESINASNVEGIDEEEEVDIVLDSVDSKPNPPEREEEVITSSDLSQDKDAKDAIESIETAQDDQSVHEESQEVSTDAPVPEETVIETESVTTTPIMEPEVVTETPVSEPESGTDVQIDEIEVATEKMVTEAVTETPIIETESVTDVPISEGKVVNETPVSEPESVTDTPVSSPETTTDSPVSETDPVPEIAPVDSSEETPGDVTSEFSLKSDRVRVTKEHIVSEDIAEPKIEDASSPPPPIASDQETTEAPLPDEVEVATEAPAKAEQNLETGESEETSVHLDTEFQTAPAEVTTPPEELNLNEATPPAIEELLPEDPKLPAGDTVPEDPKLATDDTVPADSTEVPPTDNASETAENVEPEMTTELPVPTPEQVPSEKVEAESHGHSHDHHDHHHHHHHRKHDQLVNDTDNPPSSVILVIKHLSSTLLSFLPEHLQDTILDVDDALVFTGIIALTLVSICVPYFLIEGYMSVRPLKKKVVELNKSLWKVSAAYETQQEEFEIFKQKAIAHDEFKKRADQSETDVIILKKLEVKQREQIANLRAQLKAQMKEAVDIKALIEKTLEDKKIVEEQTGKYKEAYEEAKECLLKTKDDLNNFQTHAKSSALQLGVSSKNMQVLTAKITLLQQEVEETKAHIASEIEKRQQVEADIVSIEESKTAVTKELVDLKSICHQYESTVGDLNDEISRLESELHTLKESLGEDSPLVELAEVQANASFAEREAESLRTRLDGVVADNEIMKGKLDETEKLLEEAKDDREQTNNRLQVLETYFKEREEEYVKTIEQLQQKESIRDKGKEELIKMIEEKENICLDLNERLDTLKVEFEATKQQHRNETRGLEAKGHENWLSLCQAERKAQDARKEAELLRQRLTAMSKEKDEDDVDGLNGQVPMYPLIPHELVPLPILDEPPSYFGLGDFIPPPPLDEEREPHRPPPLGGRLSPPFSDIDDHSILSPIGRRDEDCTDGSSGSESPRRSPIRGGNWVNAHHGDRDGDGGHGVMESTRRLSRPSATSSPIQHGVNL